jgi:hypothetical protein
MGGYAYHITLELKRRLNGVCIMVVRRAKMESQDKCILWHRRELVVDTGAIQYYRCKDCSARFAYATCDGYQPIDFRWVLGLSDSVRSPKR